MAEARPADPLVAGSTTAIAGLNPPESEETLAAAAKDSVVAVADDGGGRIIDYARQKAAWQQRGTLVRFYGRCASACTIYLSLPPEQLCITPSASFAFHRPIAGTGQARAGAEKYLLGIYPEWVNSWIAQQGGLRKGFITMQYHEARAFLRTCEPVSKLAEVADERRRPQSRGQL